MIYNPFPQPEDYADWKQWAAAYKVAMDTYQELLQNAQAGKINLEGPNDFQVRPTFAGQTPWDTGNFNPANYSPIGGPGNGKGFTTGDLYSRRATPSQGIIWLGDQTGGSRYLYYDGANYHMPGTTLYLNGRSLLGELDSLNADRVRNVGQAADSTDYTRTSTTDGVMSPNILINQSSTTSAILVHNCWMYCYLTPTAGTDDVRFTMNLAYHNGAADNFPVAAAVVGSANYGYTLPTSYMLYAAVPIAPFILYQSHKYNSTQWLVRAWGSPSYANLSLTQAYIRLAWTEFEP